MKKTLIFISCLIAASAIIYTTQAGNSVHSAADQNYEALNAGGPEDIAMWEVTASRNPDVACECVPGGKQTCSPENIREEIIL
ncbi:MAG: hypothetical protein J6K95_00590 [Rikenellaceae bacterium]|nr:hypothetical protein [Rikenellaceae bacterium]